MIIKMREGYDTQIGEQGTALSAARRSVWRWRGHCTAIRS